MAKKLRHPRLDFINIQNRLDLTLPKLVAVSKSDINSTWVSQDCDNEIDFILLNELFNSRKFNMAVLFQNSSGDVNIFKKVPFQTSFSVTVCIENRAACNRMFSVEIGLLNIFADVVLKLY